jgi:hypothetical protein
VGPPGHEQNIRVDPEKGKRLHARFMPWAIGTIGREGTAGG